MKIFAPVLFFGLTFSSCIDMPTDERLDSKLKIKIFSGVDRFYMSELTDFKWDSLLILKPYSEPDKMEDELEIDLSMVEHTGIEYRDDINLLVFLHQNQVVNMVEFHRYPGDFSKNDTERIPKSQAIFRIVVKEKKNINGDKWIDILKVK